MRSRVSRTEFRPHTPDALKIFGPVACMTSRVGRDLASLLRPFTFHEQRQQIEMTKPLLVIVTGAVRQSDPIMLNKVLTNPRQEPRHRKGHLPNHSLQTQPPRLQTPSHLPQRRRPRPFEQQQRKRPLPTSRHFESRKHQSLPRRNRKPPRRRRGSSHQQRRRKSRPAVFGGNGQADA